MPKPRASRRASSRAAASASPVAVQAASTRHAISRASDRQLREGEVVQLNISARVAGYSSGVGRPIVLGRIREDERDVLEFGLAAHRATESWLRAGVLASEVARRYRNYFADHNRDDLYLYGPCHGLGLIDDLPSCAELIERIVAEALTALDRLDRL